jgi:hypothetical protein
MYGGPNRPLRHRALLDYDVVKPTAAVVSRLAKRRSSRFVRRRAPSAGRTRAVFVSDEHAVDRRGAGGQRNARLDVWLVDVCAGTSRVMGVADTRVRRMSR